MVYSLDKTTFPIRIPPEICPWQSDPPVTTNLNLSARKINFNKINVNGKILKNKEDIKYIKDNFESKLIYKDLIGIFDLKNIKNFVNAIN